MIPASYPASQFFVSQRLRLHYIDWGNVDAPAMILVHGVQDHCRSFDSLARHYRDAYHVVTPDLRGHGDSEWLKGSGYGYRDYIYDLHQLILHANLAPVVLVGHSLGGAIVSLFAGIYPELVSRLVIIEGIGLWQAAQPPVDVQTRFREWVTSTRALAARAPRRYSSVEDALARMQQANPELSDAQARHLTLHGANRNEDGTYSWKYDNYTYSFSPGGFTDDEVVSLWQNIDSPTLIINAGKGLEHRIGQDDTLRHFRAAQLREIPDAGHWTYHDQTDRVIEFVDRFLTDA